jgi:nitrogen regulatory protein P-II 1
MKLITAIVRPDIVDDLVLAVTEAGAHGLTATEVIGFGRQYGHDGERNSAALLPKVRLDIAVRDDDAQNVVETIAKRANTGAIGDGKIWVTTLDAALRVRTGERDDLAL